MISEEQSKILFEKIITANLDINEKYDICRELFVTLFD
jgi:hypothetical protein